MKKLSLLFSLLQLALTVNAQISFTHVTGTSFTPLYKGEAKAADFDRDGDEDLLVTGEFSTGMYNNYPVTELYENDGTGSFTKASGLGIDSLELSSIALGDIDGDKDVDVFICGNDEYSTYWARIYKNDGSGGFSLTSNSLTGIMQGDAAFGDVDGDDDLDLIISGYTSSGTQTFLYLNDGTGSFSLTSSSFSAGSFASVQFLDTDGDGDLDVIVSGDNGGAFTELYENDGSGGFSLVSGTPFSGCFAGDIDTADVEGDGDVDVFIGGSTGNGTTQFSELYLNDGAGGYSLSGASFTGLGYTSVQFGDVDRDNDPDLILSGYDGSGNRVTELYENDGTGGFSVVGGMPFSGAQRFRHTFLDMDGDGDQDLYLSGSSGSSYGDIAELHRNDRCTSIATGTDTRTECAPYTWIDGNTYTADNNTATHTLSGGAADGCDSVVTLDLTINTVDTGITVNGFTLSSDASGAAYQWLDCNNAMSEIDGETNQSYSANGSFAVEVTENGCTDTSACETIVGASVLENSFEQAFDLYPNPTSGKLAIEFQAAPQNLRLQLYSVAGELREEQEFRNVTRVPFEIVGPKGTYLIRIDGEEGQRAVLRVVKE